MVYIFIVRPKSFDKESVLFASMLTFWKKGYACTSMRDLENATSLTPGSIYHEFGSKFELFEQSLEFYIEQIIQARVDYYLIDSDDPLNGIREFLVTTIKNVPKNVRGDACFLMNSAIEQNHIDPAVNKVINRGYRIVEKGLILQFDRARQAGQITKDIDSILAARHIIIFMSGILVASKSNTSIEVLEKSIDITVDSYR